MRGTEALPPRGRHVCDREQHERGARARARSRRIRWPTTEARRGRSRRPRGPATPVRRVACSPSSPGTTIDRPNGPCTSRRDATPFARARATRRPAARQVSSRVSSRSAGAAPARRPAVRRDVRSQSHPTYGRAGAAPCTRRRPWPQLRARADPHRRQVCTRVTSSAATPARVDRGTRRARGDRCGSTGDPHARRAAVDVELRRRVEPRPQHQFDRNGTRPPGLRNRAGTRHPPATSWRGGPSSSRRPIVTRPLVAAADHHSPNDASRAGGRANMRLNAERYEAAGTGGGAGVSVHGGCDRTSIASSIVARIAVTTRCCNGGSSSTGKGSSSSTSSGSPRSRASGACSPPRLRPVGRGHSVRPRTSGPHGDRIRAQPARLLRGRARRPRPRRSTWAPGVWCSPGHVDAAT